jgi:hypothetical protein
MRPKKNPTEEDLANMSSNLRYYYKNREERLKKVKEYYSNFRELYQEYQQEKYKEYKEAGKLFRQRNPDHPRKKYPKKKEVIPICYYEKKIENKPKKMKVEITAVVPSVIKVEKEVTLTW